VPVYFGRTIACSESIALRAPPIEGIGASIMIGPRMKASAPASARTISSWMAIRTKRIPSCSRMSNFAIAT
jgi:hypothetical protein